MKACSLNEFIDEIKPWLANDYIRKAVLDDEGHFTLVFNDGMRTIYKIDDCNAEQIRQVMADLKDKGIKVEE